MNRITVLLSAFLFAAACNNSNDKKETASTKDYEIDNTLAPSGENMSASEMEAKMALLISESKRTM
ncbi:MAG TPA: hypothetical protein VM884_07550, partial [Flavisolibacter sp.]|nr:hypothetical protein [Flavisolibacter sp.]